MRYLFIVAIILSFSSTLLAQDNKPDKALCLVCALKGETELEKVRAHSTHEGKAYYFCSKGCKKEFDADPVGYMPPVLPRPAPDFVVETLEGKDVSLKDFEKKLVILDFWASWCTPCLEIMPELQKLYEQYGDKGLAVMGVSIDEGKDSMKKINKFLKKVDISYPVFWDAKNSPAWYQFNVKAIPALFLIDENGQIVAQWTGIIDHAALDAEVASRMNASK